MEAETGNSRTTSDQTTTNTTEEHDQAYVSPDVLAAQNGEVVEFGATIVTEDDNREE